MAKEHGHGSLHLWEHYEEASLTQRRLSTRQPGSGSIDFLSISLIMKAIGVFDILKRSSATYHNITRAGLQWIVTKNNPNTTTSQERVSIGFELDPYL